MKMKNTVRAAAAFFLLLALTFALTGCDGSGYRVLMNVEHQDSHGFGMRYEKLTGQREYTVKVKEGETLEIKVSVVTDGGTLDMTIGRVGYPQDYTGSGIPTSDFSVTLTEAGKYKVIINADGHSGSFDLGW